MKRAKTPAEIRREFERARTDPVKLRRLMQRWARAELPAALDKWRPVLVATGPDNVARIARGSEIVAEFEWDRLQRTLRPADYLIVARLYHLLAEQAAFWHAVSDILEAEARAIEGRLRAGAATATDRKAGARDRDAKLRTEAMKLRRSNPALSNRDVARILSDRGLGGRHSLEKKIPGILRK